MRRAALGAGNRPGLLRSFSKSRGGVPSSADTSTGSLAGIRARINGVTLCCDAAVKSPGNPTVTARMPRVSLSTHSRHCLIGDCCGWPIDTGGSHGHRSQSSTLGVTDLDGPVLPIAIRIGAQLESDELGQFQRPLHRRKIANPKTAFRVPRARQGETELGHDRLVAGGLTTKAIKIDLMIGYANR
jgi:hypothetical protein